MEGVEALEEGEEVLRRIRSSIEPGITIAPLGSRRGRIAFLFVNRRGITCGLPNYFDLIAEELSRGGKKYVIEDVIEVEEGAIYVVVYAPEDVARPRPPKAILVNLYTGEAEEVQIE